MDLTPAGFAVHVQPPGFPPVSLRLTGESSPQAAAEGTNADALGRTLRTLTTQHREFLEAAERTVIKELRDELQRVTGENAALRAGKDAASDKPCRPEVGDFGSACTESAPALPSMVDRHASGEVQQDAGCSSATTSSIEDAASPNRGSLSVPRSSGLGSITSIPFDAGSTVAPPCVIGSPKPPLVAGRACAPARQLRRGKSVSYVRQLGTDRSSDGGPPKIQKIGPGPLRDSLVPFFRTTVVSSSDVLAAKTHSKCLNQLASMKHVGAHRLGGNGQNRLLDLVLDPRTELFAFVMIVANAVLIAVQAEVRARSGAAHLQSIFLPLEVFFCLFFLVEVVVRIAADHRHYFQGPGKVLNIWDVVLMIAQCVEVLFAVVSSGDPINTYNLSYLRILRIARAVRVFRAVRVLGHFEQGRMCIMAVMVAVQPFLASIALLSLLIMCWSVYFTDLVGSHLHSSIDADLENSDLLRMYYGGLFSTCSTLFQSISGGVDWSEPMLALPGTSERCFFGFYIAFSAICMMNVVTAILVQQVSKGLEEDKLLSALPGLVAVLRKISPSEERRTFKDDVMDCLEEAPVRVTVNGLTGIAAAANGDYQPCGVFGSRFLLEQICDRGCEPCVIYFRHRSWCIGPDKKESWAARVSLMEEDCPPSGKYRGSEEEFGTAIVKVKPFAEQQELLKCIEGLGLQGADVEGIFRLCEATGCPEVDINLFMSMIELSRSPARRLDQMVTNTGLEESSESLSGIIKTCRRLEQWNRRAPPSCVQPNVG